MVVVVQGAPRGGVVPQATSKPICFSCRSRAGAGGHPVGSGLREVPESGVIRRMERVKRCCRHSVPHAVRRPSRPLWSTMTAPGPTIKTFQKRLYTVLPRGVAATRVHSNTTSASSRALHNYSPSLPYFDPSAPTPSSRPGNPHVLSTTRLPIEARTEPEAPNSGHSQHTHTGHAPPSSLALTSPHSSNSVYSSQNGIPLANFHAPPFFLYQPFTPPSSLPSAVLDSCSLPPHASTSKLRFHFDVGAYGIPKFHSSNVISGRDGVGGADHWFHNSKPTEGLDLAVQVGEDAYFIRDNAMGVADGVGGWSRTRVLSLSFSLW